MRFLNLYHLDTVLKVYTCNIWTHIGVKIIQVIQTNTLMSNQRWFEVLHTPAIFGHILVSK